MVLVLYVMWIGKWSECSARSVFLGMCRERIAGAAVMSGDVGCWFVCGGFHVGVFVFRVMCVEFCMMSAIWVPLSNC